MPAVAEEYEEQDDQDEGNGDGFDPEHEARGDFYVAPGDPDRDECGEKREKDGGCAVAYGVAEQEICEVVEAADYAGGGGDVCEKKAPCGRGAQRWRENHRGVSVERAGRGRVAGEFSDADGDKKDSGCCEDVGEPCAVAGESADERDGGYRSSGGSDGGDGLCEGLHRREDFAAQSVSGGFGICLRHGLERAPVFVIDGLARSESGYGIGSIHLAQAVFGCGLNIGE